MRFSIKFLAALFAGLLLVLGFAFWQLTKDSIPLGFLTPYIEEALNQPDSDLKVQIGEPKLVWAGWDRAIDVVVPDVSLASEESLLPVARLSSVSVAFSIEAALEGKARLTSLDILSPTIRLVRGNGGQIRLDIVDPDSIENTDSKSEPGPDTGEARLPERPRDILEALAVLRGQKDSKHPLGALSRLSLVDGTVILDDQVSGRFWRLSDVTMDISRTANSLFTNATGITNIDGVETGLDISASLPHGSSRLSVDAAVTDLPLSLAASLFPQVSALKTDSRASLNIEAGYDLDRARHDLALDILADFGSMRLSTTIAESEDVFIVEGSFSGLQPPTVASRVPALAAIAAIDIPLRGSFSAAGLLDGTVESASLALQAGSGKLAIPELLPDPVPITEASASFSYSGRDGGIAIDSLVLDLDGPRAVLTGRVGAASSTNTREVSLDGLLTEMTLSRLDGLWPPKLAIDARDWVVGNMPEADVHQARIAVTGTLTDFDPDSFELTSLGGDILFDSAVVHYLRPMPPATDAAGLVTYDKSSLNIALSGGRVDDVSVTGGEVLIRGLDGDTENIAINLNVDTPLRDALELLDTEPYRLIEDLGLDPASVTGHGQVEAKFAFPLLKALQAKDIKFEANAGLTGPAIREANSGVLVEADGLILKVDNAGISLNGPARLDGIPATVGFNEAFGDDAPHRRKLRVAGTVGTADIAEHGLDISEYANGDAETAIVYTELNSGASTFDLTVKLDDLSVAVDALGFSKPPDVPGYATAKINLVPGQDAEIERFTIESEAINAQGSARFGPNFSQFKEVAVNPLQLEGDTVALRVSRLPESGYRIDVAGESLEIGKLLEQYEEQDETPPTDRDPSPGPPISVYADIGRLTAGETRRLDRVKMEAHYDGLHVDTLLLNASVGDGQPIVVSYLPAEGGRHDLEVTSSDAGRAMKALDWTDRIEGGALKVIGSRLTDDAPLDGKILVEDFTLARAPILAKVLEFMSLTGILSALGESGLNFDRLEGDFSYLDGNLTIKEGRAYGASLGITAKGTTNIDTGDIALEGTVATMYGISRLFENIPILNIIIGGKEGLFGANFRIDGTVPEPEVSVNPLSALAPGFIRTLFNQLPGGDPNIPVPEKLPPSDNSDR